MLKTSYANAYNELYKEERIKLDEKIKSLRQKLSRVPEQSIEDKRPVVNIKLSAQDVQTFSEKYGVNYEANDVSKK